MTGLAVLLASTKGAVEFWLVFAGIAIFAILWVFANPNSKAAQQRRGEQRCQSCHRRLKRFQGQYATVCPACGTRQERKVVGNVRTTCPSCKRPNSFNPDGFLQHNGRVKCSKCQHSYVVPPPGGGSWPDSQAAPVQMSSKPSAQRRALQCAKCEGRILVTGVGRWTCPRCSNVNLVS
jgi:predicted RNA-binding Zn-ribbon protein involved in translation (DUF1610 family)